jgi:glucose dehydrogenase
MRSLRLARMMARSKLQVVQWLLVLSPLLLSGCSRGHSYQTPQNVGGTLRQYDGTMEKDDGQWLRATKDFANTRYSSLNQITTQNVSQLRVAWTFSTGVARGQEAAPIIANHTMYVATPWPNVVYALDLTKPGAPLKWKYEPHPSPAAKGEACCDWVTRGAVFDSDKIFFNTLDGYTIALNADTGAQLWRTRLTDLSKGETITMAPMVVHNRVLVGNSGGEFGVRGWIAALDTSNGKLVWKAYNTGPDKEVLIGARFKPFYASDHGSDLGVKTWAARCMAHRGRNSLGIYCLRSISQFDLLRDRKSRPLEPRGASR